MQTSSNTTLPAAATSLLPGRGALALCIAAMMYGVYCVYAMTVSPLVRAPSVSYRADVDVPESVTNPPLTNLEMAGRHLPFVAWAADAKYQLRNADSFMFAEEYTKVAEDAVRLEPFAMIYFRKDHKPGDVPFTVTAKSAYLRFVNEIDVSKSSPGRIIAGALEGDVVIRGPDGLLAHGRNFQFTEASMRLWSDGPVDFVYDGHRGQGHGLQVELIPEPGPRKKNKFAVTGVEHVKLRRNVVMNLLFNGGRTIDGMPGSSRPRQEPAGKQPEKKRDPVYVQVRSAGAFDYGLQTHIAQFEDDVRVYRPTTPDKYDILLADRLTLTFERVPKEPVAAKQPEVKAAKTKAGGGRSPGGTKLVFRKMHALILQQTRKLVLISEENNLTAYMHQLTYDEKTKTARLLIATVDGSVRVLQDGSEIQSRQIDLTQDDAGELTVVKCTGAGWLRRVQPRTQQLELAARWIKRLEKKPDPDSDLDLIELEGRAMVRQPAEEMGLAAEFIRLWVEPRDENAPASAPRPAVATADIGGRRPTVRRADVVDESENRFQLKRMLAVDRVAMVSPDMNAQTKRLEVWFEPKQPSSSGGNPQSTPRLSRAMLTPTADRSNLGGHAPRRSPARYRRDVVRGGDASPIIPRARPAVQSQKKPADPFLPKGGGPEPQRQPAKPTAKPTAKKGRFGGSDADGPMEVFADLIRVRVLQGKARNDSDVAEIWTVGNVYVRQQRTADAPPLRITGDRMHLVNGGEQDQVLHIYGSADGKPADVYDRQLHIRGQKIHMDRTANRSWVEGAGLLQLPVDRTMEGEKLPEPVVLDVTWKEKMTFDGLSARFYRDVRISQEHSTVRCQEMLVTMSRRFSFSESNPGAKTDERAEVQSITCKDGVDFESRVYEKNVLREIRRGEFDRFKIDQQTGDTEASGPGWIAVWQRGNGNRLALAPAATVKANAGRPEKKLKWEYRRVDFAGSTKGNLKQRFNTFQERVQVVYGAVKRPLDAVDPDALPEDGGWMRCKSLEIVQRKASRTDKGHIEMVARDNVELEGRTFHAQADIITYDESKGLYTLRSLGDRKATIWRQVRIGGDHSRADAQRMEFIPSRNVLKLDRTTGLNGIR